MPAELNNRVNREVLVQANIGGGDVSDEKTVSINDGNTTDFVGLDQTEGISNVLVLGNGDNLAETDFELLESHLELGVRLVETVVQKVNNIRLGDESLKIEPRILANDSESDMGPKKSREKKSLARKLGWVEKL